MEGKKRKKTGWQAYNPLKMNWYEFLFFPLFEKEKQTTNQSNAGLFSRRVWWLCLIEWDKVKEKEIEFDWFFLFSCLSLICGALAGGPAHNPTKKRREKKEKIDGRSSWACRPLFIFSSHFFAGCGRSLQQREWKKTKEQTNPINQPNSIKWIKKWRFIWLELVDGGPRSVCSLLFALCFASLIHKFINKSKTKQLKEKEEQTTLTNQWRGLVFSLRSIMAAGGP